MYTSGDNTYYIYLSVTSFTGGKPTGQSGTKEGSGTWSGTAICTVDDPDKEYDVYGTWDTGTPNDDYYFNYNNNTYSALWEITGGDMGHPTGGGTSYGDLQ